MTADSLFAVQFDLFIGMCRFYYHHNRSRAHKIVFLGYEWSFLGGISGVPQRHLAGVVGMHRQK